MIAMMWNDLNDVCCWLLGGCAVGSPSGPSRPLALTPASGRGGIYACGALCGKVCFSLGSRVRGNDGG